MQPGATAVEAAYSFELDGLDEVGGSITANTASVTTNKTAAWNLTGTIAKDQVTFDNGWEPLNHAGTRFQQSFVLTETGGSAPCCRYSDEVYTVAITVDTDTGKSEVELYPYGGDTKVSVAAFTNTFVPAGSFSIPVEKTVVQGGEVEPAREGLLFELVDDNGKRPADYGINMTNNLISTNGTGKFTGELTGTVADTNKFKQNSRPSSTNSSVYLATFILAEQNTGMESWTFDTRKYAVDISYNSTTNLAMTETHLVGNDVYMTASFTNTFTQAKAELNKTDHFAFLSGYPDGTFRPGKNMTRAEVTVMFARLLTEKMDPNKTYLCTFKDVPAGAWYANYIGYMQRFGVINGYKDGSFRPNAPITRAEFAAIACRFEQLTEGNSTFTDVSKNHWAYKHISFAATRGWVTGYPDGTFRSNNKITRAEVASVTCRLLERNVDRKYVEDNSQKLPKTFSDVKSGNWAWPFIIEAANGHNYIKNEDGTETWTDTYE